MWHWDISTATESGKGDGALLWIAAQIFFLGSRSGKSITVVELKEKGTVELRTIPLEPLRGHAENPGHVSGSHGKIIL